MKSGINGFPSTSSSSVAGVAGVTSFNGRAGIVISQSGDYNALMVGADAIGTANTLIGTHISNIDPHTQYQTETELESIVDNLITTYNNSINV